MPISHVVRMPTNKSFGFIKGVGADDDYFFHKADFDGKFGELVQEFGETRIGAIQLQFDIEQSPKGLRAVNVKRV